MDLLNIRRMEVITGKYHHLEIIRFIHNILLEYSTPLNQSYVKPIISNSYITTPMDTNHTKHANYTNHINHTIKNIYHFDDGRKNELTFRTSIAYNENENSDIKVLFISKNPLNNYETILPAGYKWIDDKIIYNTFILNYNNFLSNALSNIDRDQNTFKEFHLFIAGFENLLEKCIIPQYIELSKNNTKMEIINKYLTIPVAIAFDRILGNTNLSFTCILFKNGISKNNLEWIQTLNQKYNVEFLSKYCYDLNFINNVINLYHSNKYSELIKNFT